MIDQEEHGFVVLSVRSQDLVELVERAAAIDHVADHLEVAEFHVGANLSQEGLRVKERKDFRTSKEIFPRVRGHRGYRSPLPYNRQLPFGAGSRSRDSAGTRSFRWPPVCQWAIV